LTTEILLKTASSVNSRIAFFFRTGLSMRESGMSIPMSEMVVAYKFGLTAHGTKATG
jgi:hypothetical protein